ncbi:MAG: S41 family peptidase [Acidobacteria bacterium]|nr:S41 family peptidase [Acidobacteriota bacterium]
MLRSTFWVLAGAVLFSQGNHLPATPPIESASSPSGVRPQPGSDWGAAARAELIEKIADQLDRNYVDGKAGREIGELLKQKLKGGAYDRLDRPAQFAEAVTQDLQRTNGDLHLTLRYSPDPAGARGGGQPGFDPFAGARQQNFGINRAEILEGNVGYLAFSGFLQGSGWEETLVDALRFLSRTDAMIIDLRMNGGGSGHMGDFLLSHFLEARAIPTVRIKSRHAPEPLVIHSLAAVPGPRRPDVPLYLLASQGTGSAAEAFAFVLKNLRRATVIGTRTAGAGNTVGFFPAGQGFTLGYSITHVSDPRTGSTWEQVGVQPDVAVSPEWALQEAHVAALQRLIDTIPDPNRVRVLKRLVEAAQARRRPLPVDRENLARYEGNYGGRVVRVREGRVTYARNAGALPEELVHLGGGRFALGAARICFEDRDGMATLILERSDGTEVSLPRSVPTFGF